MVSNGGFEQGLSYWNQWSSVSTQLVTDPVVEGSYAAYLEGINGIWQYHNYGVGDYPNGDTYKIVLTLLPTGLFSFCWEVKILFL